MKRTFIFVAMILLCAGTTIHVLSQVPSEIGPGVAHYPRVSYLPEASRRIGYNKTGNWIAVAAYHSDDSITDVVKYFKERSRNPGIPKTGNPILRTMLRDNWKIDVSTIPGALAIFGIDDVLRVSYATLRAQSSFGVFVFPDFIARIHLISPRPSESNEVFVQGTMIVVIREQLPTQAAANTRDSKDIYKGRDTTRRARITSRPEPEYTGEARSRGIIGTVVLRAVFAANGKVEDITVVAGLPAGLTERAIKAARKIEFEPAVKDGRYVSQYIQLEFNFNL